MHYPNTLQAVFEKRISRFSAIVQIEGKSTEVHVKNTGRLKELLLPGALVCLQKADHPKRKTAYDLISVLHEPYGWVNIDSQICSDIFEDYLRGHTAHQIQREVRHGDSRLDFLLDQSIYVEVKGCTLRENDHGLFPDAPTKRGVKHLQELTALAKAKKEAWVVFVLAMNGVQACDPNSEKDPEFARMLKEARQNGVRIFDGICRVEADGIWMVSFNEKE